MQILNNVLQQLQLQNNAFIQQYKQVSQRMSIQIFLNPITKAAVDLVYNIINTPQFTAERQSPATPHKNDIDIIIDSGGGDADAAYHIAKILNQNFTGTIRYIIPRYAKSAATLLACGGDKIVMGDTSELGPLDPQIQQSDGSYISAKSVQSTLELINSYLGGGGKQGLELATILSSRLNPLVLGQYQSTMDVAQSYQKELLSLRMYKGGDPAKVEEIAKKFATGYTHHSRVINCQEAQEIFGSDKVEIWNMSNPGWTFLWQLCQNNRAIADIVAILPLVNKLQ